VGNGTEFSSPFGLLLTQQPRQAHDKYVRHTAADRT